MLGVCLKYDQINYGSKLQALATVKLFEKYNIDYEILRYKKTLGFYIKSLPRFFNYVFLNDRYDQLQRSIEYKRHPDLQKLIAMRNNKFKLFDVHFVDHLSNVYGSYAELKRKCKENYTQLITCSDQLWSPSALGSGFYNLMFAPSEVPKISWASSFGVSNIPWYQKSRTKTYLNRIEYISMRENRGAEIVHELIGREVPVLMDPVFVFTQDEWDAMVPYRAPEWDNYIFCYFLGSNPEHRAAANELAARTGLKIVTLRHLDRYNAEDEQFGDYAPYDVDPNRFLNILRNATYVCTDSFHGTAFSAIFQKKFMVFNRYSDSSSNSKNSRIDSVCSNLGLCERRYLKQMDIVKAMQRDINYDAVLSAIECYRQKTLQYLKNAFGV